MAFGLWRNTPCHRKSPDTNQHWAFILAPMISSLLHGSSATEHIGGWCTVSSVLTYVEESCCHWLLGVVMWSSKEQQGFYHSFELVVIQILGILWKT